MTAGALIVAAGDRRRRSRRAPIRMPVFIGLLAVLAFFGGFGVWAAVAPLESAAIAPGVVVVDTNRKVVQHLEGGIVGEILVQEGTRVAAGDVVVRLDETLPRANRQLLLGQLRSAVALEARLVAQRDGKATIAFPEWLLAAAGEQGVSQILTTERNVFAAQREGLASQADILTQRNAQFDEEIVGVKAEIAAQSRQLALIAEEVKGVEALVAKGLERRPRLLALQREAADIEGARAQNQARIARTKQSIGENELRIVDLRVQFLNDTVQKLRDEETRISDLRERLRAAEDVLSRTAIRSPVSGRVVNLKVFTAGGVIAPREPLMEVVPEDDRLIVEVQVAPRDIDVVAPGLPVNLRFTAFNHRTTPTLRGRVLEVSADRVVDQRSGQPYYAARVAVEDELPQGRNFKLYPGMPVEAMIVTGEQTPIRYLLKPILAGFARAIRED